MLLFLVEAIQILSPACKGEIYLESSENSTENTIKHIISVIFPLVQKSGTYH